MNRFYILLLTVCLAVGSNAQTARLQVIHNSPLPGTEEGPIVDIYVNGTLLEEFTAITFRSATPFLDVAAGTEVTIDVATSPSNSVEDAFFTKPLGQLLEKGTYIAVAHGIVGDGDTPFDIGVNAMARESALQEGNVEFTTFHGAADATNVDIDARNVETLISDLPYGQFAEMYTSVTPASYTLDIRATGNADVLASFIADLSLLADEAATVIASGFLNTTPGFGLFAVLTDGTVVEFPLITEPPALVINEVDYDQPGFDDAEFIELRNNSEKPVSLNGTEIVLINGSNEETYNTSKLPDVTLEAGGYYVVCYGNNSAEYCDFIVSGSTVQNGAPDGIQLLFNGQVIDALSYEGTIDGVAEGIGTSAQDDNNNANLSLSRSPDGADTDNNDADFIEACSSPGEENKPSTSCEVAADSALVQIIHNAPSPTVDIYVDNVIVADDLTFRSATPFVKVPAGVDIEIAVAPDNSTSAAEAIATFTYNLAADQELIAVARGVLEDENTPLGIDTFGMARTESNAAVVDLLVYHGSPGAGPIDIANPAAGVTLFGDVAYGEFRGYLPVLPGIYTLRVTPGNDNSVLVGNYRLDVNGLGGTPLTVFASGFLDERSPEFQLWAADPQGNSFKIEQVFLDSADVQIIHNSPSTPVDIYVDGEIFLTDFEYQTATPFVKLAANKETEIAIAAAPSISAEEAIFTLNTTFGTDSIYTIVANGSVDSQEDPFNLEVSDMGRTAGISTDSVDVNVFHGSAGSPAVDVAARGVGELFTNLSYKQFSPYVTVPPSLYTLDVKAAGTDNVVGSFDANLEALSGGAVTVVAYGELESASAPFGLLAVFPDGNVLDLPETPSAKVQLIHNSPTPMVDVYANGELILDNFEYRTATPYLELPAGVEIEFAVALDTSTSVESAIFRDTITLLDDASYSVVANGQVGNSDFPFDLVINTNARNVADDGESVDVNIFHGAINAPTVDVAARNVGNLFSGVAYDDFTDYRSVPAGEYFFDVTVAGTELLAGTYAAMLDTLAGQSITVVASGIFGGEPGFAPLAILANGTVVELPLSPVANVQVIHNSPMPTVDVYANGELLIDNFEYRIATAFDLLPAGVEIELAVALDTSTSAESAIFRDTVILENALEYTVIANGQVGNADFPFRLAVNEGARSSASDGERVEVNIFHGAIEASAVEVDARTVGNLFSEVSYGNFTDYTSFLADEYFIDIREAGTSTILNTYNAVLDTLAGQAVTVIASGILDGDPGFALLAVLADGTVIELPAAPVANVQIIHNSPTPTVDLYANGELIIDNFEYREAEPFQFFPAGVEIELAVALDTSTSVESAIFRDTITFENGLEYTVIANGEVGNNGFSFGLAFNADARSAAADGENIDINVFHGAIGAPPVDVDVRRVGTLFPDLSYDNFSDYETVPAADYFLDVRLAGGGNIVETFSAPLADASGQSVTVVASGIFGGEPGFAALAVFADGTVIELPTADVANVQIIHNSPTAPVDIYANGSLLIDDFEYQTAEPFEFLIAGTEIELAVAPDTSTSAESAIFRKAVTFENGLEYTVIANGIVGDTLKPFDLFISDGARSIASDPELVAFNIFHGATDAPNVDVNARNVVSLTTNLEFGEITNYFSVPADLYYIDILASGQEGIVATFAADLSMLTARSATVIASGFLNSDPATFTLLAVLDDGTVINLPIAQVAGVQIIHNSPDQAVDVYANGALLIDNFEFRSAEPFEFLMAGVEIALAVAPDTSTSVESAILNDTVVLENGQNYIIFATGIVGDTSTPFQLARYEGARVNAATGSGVDLLLYHGSTDAPTVDVLTANSIIFDSVAYNDFQGYFNVPAVSYILDITPAGENDNIVASYSANVTPFESGAAVVFATGFFSGEAPGFALWVALPDGTTFPLDLIVSANELETFVESFRVFPNPVRNSAILNYILKESAEISLNIFNQNGQLIRTTYLGQQVEGEHFETINASELPSGQYFISLTSGEGIITTRMIVTK